MLVEAERVLLKLHHFGELVLAEPTHPPRRHVQQFGNNDNSKNIDLRSILMADQLNVAGKSLMVGLPLVGANPVHLDRLDTTRLRTLSEGTNQDEIEVFLVTTQEP